jgi:hypothetical protein
LVENVYLTFIPRKAYLKVLTALNIIYDNNIYIYASYTSSRSYYITKQPVSITACHQTGPLPRVTGHLLELPNARCMSHDIGHTDPTLLGGTMPAMEACSWENHRKTIGKTHGKPYRKHRGKKWELPEVEVY